MSALRAPPGVTSNEGFALVAVLGFLLVAAAFITPFAVTARTQHLIAANVYERQKLNRWADAISWVVAQHIASRSEEPLIPPNSAPVLCMIGGYEIQIRGQSQNGLIDLNSAAQDLIDVGFQSLGFGEDLSNLLSRAVTMHRGYAQAPPETAQTLNISAGLKHSPLESVAELYDLSALGETELANLHRVFTVHSKRGFVSMAHTPPQLMPYLNSVATQEGSDTDTVEFFALEVSVKSTRTSIRGYSGFIFQPPSLQEEVPARIEPLFEPAFVQAVGGVPERCSPRLRDTISDLLREIGQ